MLLVEADLTLLMPKRRKPAPTVRSTYHWTPETAVSRHETTSHQCSSDNSPSPIRSNDQSSMEAQNNTRLPDENKRLDFSTLSFQDVSSRSNRDDMTTSIPPLTDNIEENVPARVAVALSYSSPSFSCSISSDIYDGSAVDDIRNSINTSTRCGTPEILASKESETPMPSRLKDIANSMTTTTQHRYWDDVTDVIADIPFSDMEIASSLSYMSEEGDLLPLSNSTTISSNYAKCSSDSTDCILPLTHGLSPAPKRRGDVKTAQEASLLQMKLSSIVNGHQINDDECAIKGGVNFKNGAFTERPSSVTSLFYCPSPQIPQPIDFAMRHTNDEAENPAMSSSRFHSFDVASSTESSELRDISSSIFVRSITTSNSDFFSPNVQSRRPSINSVGTNAESINDSALDSWTLPLPRESSLRSSFSKDTTSKLKTLYPESEIYRPVPDQSAFDRYELASTYTATMDKYLPESQPWTGTPFKGFSLCPETPVRAAIWRTASNISYSTSVGDLVDTAEMAPEVNVSEPMSLNQNKVLVSNTHTPDRVEMCFYRDFEQEGFLGSGSSADVFRARLKRSDKSYAIKKIKHQFRSEKDRNVMMEEVVTMTKVGEEPCEYIVQLIRAWQEDAYFFLQIEFAEKGSLRDLMRDVASRGDVFSDSCVWNILHDACSGLCHIHKCGIVHLDIKPANLLITKEGIVKIGDFGLAVSEGYKEDAQEGDMRYMAPELLNSSDRHPPADVFSMALTLYEVCILEERRQKAAAGLSSLPSEGPEWHSLREGDAPCLVNRDQQLCALIQLAMSPVPSSRLTAEAIAAAAAKEEPTRTPDVMLMLAAAPYVGPKLARAKSFVLSMDSLDTTATSTPSRFSDHISLSQEFFESTTGKRLRSSPHLIEGEGKEVHGNPFTSKTAFF